MDYKEYHELQMVNHSGSSVIEIELLLTTVILGIFLVLLIEFYTSKKNSWMVFLVNFILIAMPITLSVTLLSGNYIILLNMVIILMGIKVFKGIETYDVKKMLYTKLGGKKSYITNYRACTNLISSLCILAVDFSIFPRRFAKTETFGFGLMDVGVGFFILSNGLVAKNIITRSDMLKTLKSCSVLIALGMVRLISVKGLDYHEHASEYGVHWNFFFTLAFCRILSFFIFIVSPMKRPFFLALSTGIIHQCLLHLGLQEWVFSEIPRDTLLSANREGLASLLGYVSLYYGSVTLGEIINRTKSLIDYKTLLKYLSATTLVLWTCTWICYITIGVSRRLVNVGYIFWVIASTSTVMTQLSIVDLLISSMEMGLKKKKQFACTTPLLMECINSNGLCFFLFSNLLTGIINCSFQTLLLDTISSMTIIITYMLTICGASYLFYSRKWILKFW